MTSLRTSLAAAWGGWTMAFATAQVPLSVDPTFVAPFTESDIYGVAFHPGGNLMVYGMMRYPGEFQYRGLYSLHNNGALNTQYLFPSPSAYNAGDMRLWNDEFFFLRQGQGVFRKYMADGSTDHSYSLLSPHFSTSQLSHFHLFPDGSQWRTGWFIKRIFDDEGNQIGSIPGYGFLRVLPNGSRSGLRPQVHRARLVYLDRRNTRWTLFGGHPRRPHAV